MPPPSVYQVFGANTDVGKTVVTTGLLRAAAATAASSSSSSHKRRVTYIKPLQTGAIHDADFVKQHTTATSSSTPVHCHTLFSWRTPVSPHLAAAKEDLMVSDAEILAKLQAQLQQDEAEDGSNIIVVETAGGVLSPGPSSAATTQADVYRPLRLPVILVGDGRLGGISATLSAYESLCSRGYDVHVIAILDSPDHLDNASAVATYITTTLGHKKLPVVSLPPLPQMEEGNATTDLLGAWYKQHDQAFLDLLAVVEKREEARLARLGEMTRRASEIFWYPFTQHRGLSSEQLHVVDSAYGDYYTILSQHQHQQQQQEKQQQNGGSFSSSSSSLLPYQKKDRLIDACASWWTQGLGHGRADVALAVGAAAGRYGHVIFPGNVHEPALRLAELMLEGPGKGWATRVFFSDNGSTAMEIAVKMALKKTAVQTVAAHTAQGEEEAKEETVVVAVVTQQDCYHGDTLGCMDAAAPTVFNTGQHPWYVPRTLSLAVPTIGWVQGELQVEVPAEISTSTRTLLFPEGMSSLLDLPAREQSKAATMYRESIRAQMDAFEGVVVTDAETKENGSGGGAAKTKQQAPRRKLGAILLEPVLMGAAGMILVDPLFQRILTLEGRARGLPIVFDEVASGLHRLGCASTCEILGVYPDIACYGKTLTGGYLPLALTLTTEEIFEAFQGPAKSDALLHGHSYTANPLACAAAVRALEAYATMGASGIEGGNGGNGGNGGGTIQKRQAVYQESQIATLSTIAGVRRAVGLGTVLAVEVEDAEGTGGYGSMASAKIVQELKAKGVYARPLGNVVYLLASQVASQEIVQTLIDALENVLRHRAEDGGKDTSAEAGATNGVVI